MKKLLIATLFSAFALTSQAQWYVQGDLGASRVADDSDLVDDTVFTQRISAGYDFGQFRVAADYTNFGETKNSYSSADLKVKVKSVGVSAFYDFENNSDFTPYLGVRLAHNRATISESYYGYGDSYSESSSGAGALGGVQYKVSKNLLVNAGLEANRLASDVYQVGGNIGLRYNF